MFHKISTRFATICIFLFALTLMAAGQGPRANINTTSSDLEMTANLVTTVQLNIGPALNGAAVSGDEETGLFNVSFGNVNGLGIGPTFPGVSVVKDSTGALYKTRVNLTPVYTGFTSERAVVTVEAGNSGDESLAREGNSSISSASTVSTTPRTVISNALSGSTTTRYIGLYIPKSEPAGSKRATLVYTITVQ